MSWHEVNSDVPSFWFMGESKAVILKFFCNSILQMSAFRVPPLSASDESRKSCTVGMVTMILTLLSSAWFPLDLSAHQDALILAGNLLAGIGTELKEGF